MNSDLPNENDRAMSRVHLAISPGPINGSNWESFWQNISPKNRVRMASKFDFGFTFANFRAPCGLLLGRRVPTDLGNTRKFEELRHRIEIGLLDPNMERRDGALKCASWNASTP